MKAIPAENIFLSGSGSNKSLFRVHLHIGSYFLPCFGKDGNQRPPTNPAIALPDKTMQPMAAGISPRTQSSSSGQSSSSTAQAQPPSLAAEDDSRGAEGITAVVLRHGQSPAPNFWEGFTCLLKQGGPRPEFVSPGKGTSLANDLWAKIFASRMLAR